MKQKGARKVDVRSQQIKNEMDRLKALIMEEMGGSRSAVTGDGCTASWTTVCKPGIYKESLERMKALRLVQNMPRFLRARDSM